MVACRGRLLAAFLALAVGVSVSVVSAVVAGSSAGAANTASEALFDSDDDAATPLVRQFAGADRYATSVRLAEQYVEIVSSPGTVILASGDSLVDAAAAAGLSVSQEAPVLLTPTQNLSSAVANFINEERVSEVYIVGGTSAVSQKVEDAIAALASVNTVNRLAGADRYSTSVLLAEETGLVETYCGANLTTVVLANVDSSFADVIAIGPLAYALELPVLLTSADALPADVASYLSDQGVEQIIVVGGTAAVSNAVVSQARDAGVDIISRISGENRFATALAIRTELANCSAITLSPTTIALVNGEAAADGVAAGPVLGIGLANDGVTPVLLVSTAGLPPETSGFLAGTTVRNTDGTYVNLSLTAIGGTAVVSDAVMAAAVAAAITSKPLTATIAVKAATATVTFSDQVNSKGNPGSDSTAAEKVAFASSALNKANYLVGGAALTASDTLTFAGRVLTITFGSNELTRNKAVSVVLNKIKGVGADNRLVKAATLAVPDLSLDEVSPRIQIHAAQGGRAIRLSIIEGSLVEAVGRLSFAATDPRRTDTTAVGNSAEVALLSKITITDTAGTIHPLHTGTGASIVLYSSTSRNIYICLFGRSDLDGPVTVPAPMNTCTAPPATVPAVTTTDTRPRTVLAAGDRITVGDDAFADTAGNLSASTSVVVNAYQAYPRIIRVFVTSPTLYDPTPLVPGDESLATWQWASYVADNTLGNNYLAITARADGIAAGAPGNAWQVAWIALPGSGKDDGADDGDDIPVVKVNVDEQRKIINIEFDDDAKVLNAVTALNENDFVASNFFVTSDAFTSSAIAGRDIAFEDEDANAARLLACSGAAVGICGAPSAEARWTLAGGESVVTLLINFSEYVRYFDSELLIASNNEDPNFPSAIANWVLGFTPIGEADSRTDLYTEFTYTLYTAAADLEDLPKAGETILLPGGVGETYAPSDCAGFFQIGTNACGESIRIIEQRIRAILNLTP